MATVVGRKSCKTFLGASSTQNSQMAKLSYKTVGEGLRRLTKNKKAAIVGGISLAAAVGVAGALQYRVAAHGLDPHPPHQHFSHSGWFSSFDAASVRRGYFVYKQVCSACHSMQHVHYRDFVNVIFTEAEAKEEAKNAEIRDGPGEDGEMYTRPGKLSDKLPAPYKNIEAAKYANNGAHPPDLSFMGMTHESEEHYIFALLNGYTDPPPGMEPIEGLHYNPYFHGSWINMTPPLYSEIIEYEDGTPATQSQLAKDVSTFLRWTSEYEHDERKRMLIKCMAVIGVYAVGTWYWRRHKWQTLRTQVIHRLPDRKPNPKFNSTSSPVDRPFTHTRFRKD